MGWSLLALKIPRGISEKIVKFVISAKEKMRKKRIHETGGGPAPPELTPIEEAVWTILGTTPGFIGVQPRTSDSKITIKRGQNTNDLTAKVCNATMLGKTGGLTRTLNTSKTI